MSSAGQQLLAGRVPGERIATAVETTDSAGFTATEVELMSVVAPLVVGRTYRVRFSGGLSGETGDRISVGIREDNSNGTQLNALQLVIAQGTAGGYGFEVEAEYTAPATENKTFSLTGDRFSGTGTCRLDANSSQPAYLYVDYITG